MAITEEGELYSCGYNARGQLGLEHITHVCTPKLVRALASVRVTKVACSYYHTIVATENDVVYAFGRNDFGQLGCGTEEDTSAPKPVDALRGRHVVSLACGQYHTIVACESPYGCVAFGKNDYGQLGIAATNAEPKLVPTPLGPIPDEDGRVSLVAQVACGYYHTVGITEEGKVFSFGRNDYGQLGHGDRQNVRNPRIVDALRDETVIQVSCGCYHTLFLVDDGRAYSVGRNNHGQLGINTQHDSAVPEKVPGMKPISLLAAGFYHSICMTSSDGGGHLGPNQRHQVGASLSNDMRKMLNNSARSDVTFIVEGRPIYAHRCIIMARCEPLERMLEGPMRESQERDIVLHDMKYDPFFAFVEFLYTDHVEGLHPRVVSLEFALDLLSVADQFLVQSLKGICESAIEKSISVDNVALMLRTADERQALNLRKKCFQFLMRNFGKVIGTPSFAELPKDLLQEVLFAAAKRGVYLRS